MSWSKKLENAEHTSIAPALHAIRDKLGPDVREKVIVGDKTFWLQRPKESDRLLDHPAVHAAFAKDEYMPYWADIWPASRMLAKALLAEQELAGSHVLEVGCGLGLAGLAALSIGMRVTFSDYDPCALHYAAQNARENGFDNFDVMQLDWRLPPHDLRVPVILMADLVYEVRNVDPLVRFIQHVLTEDGVCLLTDQDRIPSKNLRDALAAADLPYTTQMMRAGEPGGRRSKGTLYRIRKNAKS